jgi:hypothetical protein
MICYKIEIHVGPNELLLLAVKFFRFCTFVIAFPSVFFCFCTFVIAFWLFFLLLYFCYCVLIVLSSSILLLLRFDCSFFFYTFVIAFLTIFPIFFRVHEGFLLKLFRHSTHALPLQRKSPYTKTINRLSWLSWEAFLIISHICWIAILQRKENWVLLPVKNIG